MEDAPKPCLVKQYQTTFYEMAIACDVLTGGVIAPKCDLLTKAMYMRAAFTHYYRKSTLTYGEAPVTYQDYFMPVSHAGSLTLVGAQRKHGVKRRMLLESAQLIPSVIAANIVLANQTVTNTYDLGYEYYISRIMQPQWEHDTHTHYTLQCEQYVRHRNAASASASIRVPPEAQTEARAHTAPEPIHSRRRPRQGPCVHGHPTTSAADPRGKPRWNMAPDRPPFWAGVPPGSTLCQRCYEHYRAAHDRGTVPTIPPTPRLLNRPCVPIHVPDTPLPTPIPNPHARPPG